MTKRVRHRNQITFQRLRRLFSLSLFFLTQPGMAQSDTQFWYETMVNCPFANVYNLESAFTYATTVNNKPKWANLDLQETLERSLSQHFDLMGAFLFSNTIQNDSLSTRELRPTLGFKIHFTPNSRILTRLLVRFENRNFLNTETDTWSGSNRSRVRFESIIPFNKPTMFAGDKLWYGIFDAELFIVQDQQLHERFANRFRLRAALGYRLSYDWRFELMYTLQESQNEIGTAFTTLDNIYRVRVKFYLNKSKPAKGVTGPGN